MDMSLVCEVMIYLVKYFAPLALLFCLVDKLVYYALSLLGGDIP